jgi:Periplasmic binding protein
MATISNRFGGEINLEAIANEKPDLILAIYDTIDQDLYNKFSQIAPTVVQSAEYADEATPWDVQTLTLAKHLANWLKPRRWLIMSTAGSRKFKLLILNLSERRLLSTMVLEWKVGTG